MLRLKRKGLRRFGIIRRLLLDLMCCLKTEKMEESVLKITKLVFKLICLALTTFMSITQVLRYIDNNDKASVTFRRFNHSPRDRYPTYTICFENQNRRGEFYNQTYLLNKFGINGSDYFQMISGLDVNGYLPKSSMLSDIDFELASIHPKEIIREYFARYNKGKHRYVKSQLNKNLKVNRDLSWINPIQAEYIESKDGKALEFSKQLPFYKSYQDYNRICLTRNNTYRKGMSYSFEHLAIWTRRIKNFDKIRIYFHHPYQAMRTFFNRFYSKPYISLDLQKRRNYNNIRFRFSQLSVLRKRRDANNPCIPDL